MNGSIISETKPFRLSIAMQTPEDFAPIGDRYLVEVLDIDDSVMAGEHRLLVPQKSADDRGWKAAVVITVGDGLTLDHPGRPVAMENPVDPALSVEEQTKGAVAATNCAVVVDVPARVPMVCAVGDVVLVEKFAGRDVYLQGRAYLVVAQPNLLCRHRGLRLSRGEDGAWHPC